MEKHRGGVKSTWRRRRAPLCHGWLYIYRAFHPQHPPHLLCFTVLCCYVALCIEKVQRQLDDVSHPLDLPPSESTGFLRTAALRNHEENILLDVWLKVKYSANLRAEYSNGRNSPLSQNSQQKAQLRRDHDPLEIQWEFLK